MIFISPLYGLVHAIFGIYCLLEAELLYKLGFYASQCVQLPLLSAPMGPRPGLTKLALTL